MLKYLFNIRFLYIFIVLLLTYISPINVSSQATGDPREDFLYGEYYVSMGLYQKALPFFLSTLSENPDNSNLNYRTGLCYLKAVGEQRKALPYLQIAVLEINDHYVEGKYKETGAPPESWLLLGEAYHRENNLTEASKAYHIYRDLIAETDKKMLEVVMKRISGLGISYEYQRDEDVAVMVNMGEQINSRFSDYNPVLSGDQSLMFYTQYWESYDRIMMTRKIGEEWTMPVEVNDDIGSMGNCYTSALSFDGTELYLVRYDEIDFEIVVSRFQDGVWGEIEEIGGKVNSRYRETSVSISGDDNTLYFASDRPGGEGGFDIFVAQRIGNEWGDVSNLGIGINTDKNEEAPFISYDGVMLIFSSNGHETIGNLDVVYSEIDERGNWTRPRNLGSPINTTNDDLFYVYFKDERTGYFSRDFPGGYGKNDIYILKGSEIESDKEDTEADFVESTYKADEPIESIEKASIYSEEVQVAEAETEHAPISYTQVAPDNQNNEYNPVISDQEQADAITGKSDLVNYDDSGDSDDKSRSKSNASITGTAVPVGGGAALGSLTALSNVPVSKATSVTGGRSEPGQASTYESKETPVEYNEYAYQYNESDKSLSSESVYTEETAIQSDYEVQEEVLVPDQPTTEMLGIDKEYGTTSTNYDYTESSSSTQESSYDYSNDNWVAEQETATSSAVYAAEETTTRAVQSKTTDTYADGYSSVYDKSATTDNLVGVESLVVNDYGVDETVSDYDVNDSEDYSVSELSNNYAEASEYKSEKYYYSDNQDEITSQTTFIIQIYALKKWVDKEKIKLSPLVVSAGNDGFYRYTYGEFPSMAKAFEKLDSIINMGYRDAFIRVVSSVQNYEGN